MPTVIVGLPEKKGETEISVVRVNSRLSDIEHKGAVIEEKEFLVPPLGEPVDEKRFWFQRNKKYDPNAIATMPSVFDNPDTASQYQPPSNWENIHRFNPLARWTWGEESKLVKKLDVRIMIWCCVMLMVQELDRANLTQALTDNFLGDLHMTTNDYNLGQTIFKFCYLFAEIPLQLLSKRLGPDRWLPVQMTLWGMTATCQFFVKGRTSFLICRALLGIMQGGFNPQVILYLSQFYKHHELAIRIGFYYTAMGFADMFASVLAFGILHMRGVDGLAGWRWLFLLEGLFSVLMSINAYVLMPAGPCQTASKIRGKNGWFTPREEEILVNRLVRDDPSKSTMHNRQGLTPKMFLTGLLDYNLWPLYFMGLVFHIPTGPPQQYLTLTLRGLGFDKFQTNLLAIPHTALHVMNMLIVAYAAEAFENIGTIATLCQVWALPFLIFMNVSDITKINRWNAFMLVTLLVGGPTSNPIQASWASRNSNAIYARAVSAALYNMFVQAGGMVYANVYRESDKPRYRKGNKVLLSICVFNICFFSCVKLFFKYRNKRRAQKWSKLTLEQQVDYLSTTQDTGNRRLDFRFSH